MTRRSGIMLAYPLEEKRLMKWSPPFIVQPKLDGVRCRAVPYGDQQEYMLTSSEDNMITFMQHIELALKALPVRYEFDGELYNHSMSFEEIFSRVSRSVTIHDRYDDIEFYIFDICDETLPQSVRTRKLMDLRDLIRWPLQLVPFELCHNLKQVLLVHESYREAGYEGIIVRNVDAPYIRRRSTGMMKFKAKKRDSYRILGWKEEISIEGNPKNRLGALICTSGDGEVFSVGSGLTDDQREALWLERESLVGKWCVIEYQHTTPSRRVPRFPVLMRIL